MPKRKEQPNDETLYKLDPSKLKKLKEGRVIGVYQNPASPGFYKSYERHETIGYFVKRDKNGLWIASEKAVFDNPKKDRRYNAFRNFDFENIRGLGFYEISDKDKLVFDNEEKSEDRKKKLEERFQFGGGIVEVFYIDHRASYNKSYLSSSVGVFKEFDDYNIEIIEDHIRWNDVDDSPNIFPRIRTIHISDLLGINSFTESHYTQAGNDNIAFF